jgi:hypothetical protein
MEAKALRFHKTEGANNHIKQGDTLVFACNPIGVAAQERDLRDLRLFV